MTDLYIFSAVLGNLFTWAADNNGAITSLTAISALVIGAATALVGIRTLRQSRQSSIDRSRPYVYASIVPSMGGRRAWDLVIKNVGLTSAYGLTLSNSKWPKPGDELTKELKHLFDTPRTLPPGTSIRTYWNVNPLKKDDGQNSGVTDPVKVTVSYQGPTEPGWRKKSETYTDSFDLDPTAVGMTPLGFPGEDIPRRERDPKTVKLQELVQALNELRRNL